MHCARARSRAADRLHTLLLHFETCSHCRDTAGTGLAAPKELLRQQSGSEIRPFGRAFGFQLLRVAGCASCSSWKNIWAAVHAAQVLYYSLEKGVDGTMRRAVTGYRDGDGNMDKSTELAARATSTQV